MGTVIPQSLALNPLWKCVALGDSKSSQLDSGGEPSRGLFFLSGFSAEHSVFWVCHGLSDGAPAF